MKIDFEITEEELKQEISKYITTCTLDDLIDTKNGIAEKWIRVVFQDEVRERIKQEVKNMKSEVLQEAITEEIQKRCDDIVKMSIRKLFT